MNLGTFAIKGTKGSVLNVASLAQHIKLVHFLACICLVVGARGMWFGVEACGRLARIMDVPFRVLR